MKKIVTVQEIQGQGLEALLGKTVVLFCANYIYTGTLTGVNVTDIILENAAIVYATGAFTAKQFSDVQKLPGTEWRLRTAAIESYGEWVVA